MVIIHVPGTYVFLVMIFETLTNLYLAETPTRIISLKVAEVFSFQSFPIKERVGKIEELFIKRGYAISLVFILANPFQYYFSFGEWWW